MHHATHLEVMKGDAVNNIPISQPDLYNRISLCKCAKRNSWVSANGLSELAYQANTPKA